MLGHALKLIVPTVAGMQGAVTELRQRRASMYVQQQRSRRRGVALRPGTGRLPQKVALSLRLR